MFKKETKRDLLTSKYLDIPGKYIVLPYPYSTYDTVRSATEEAIDRSLATGDPYYVAYVERAALPPHCRAVTVYDQLDDTYVVCH